MEAIILAGGKAERLGDAAGGKPKALVPVAGRALAGYQVVALRGAGVDHVIMSCAAGTGGDFESALEGSGVDMTIVEEPEPLGRGGGLRFAAAARRDEGDVYALNGDELLALDLAALLARHRETGAAATITVTQPPSSFGVVELNGAGMVTGFEEAAVVPYWVSCGVYVLGEEAVAALPERGDHETTTFPELAGDGRLAAYRYDGVWLTVNTPKDLRHAEEYVDGEPALARRVTECAFEPRRVDKPWGWELIWALTERYCGKLLFVRAGESLSLQYHEAKDESWYVQEGRAELELSSVGDADREQVEIRAGDCFRFRPQTVHRLRAIEDTLVIEVSTPEIDDVVRLEDVYGREGTSEP